MLFVAITRSDRGGIVTGNTVETYASVVCSTNFSIDTAETLLSHSARTTRHADEMVGVVAAEFFFNRLRWPLLPR